MANEDSPRPENPELAVSRRQFLRRAGAWAGGAMLVSAMGGGCRLFEDAEIRAASVSGLKANGPLVAEFNGDAIFVALGHGGAPYCLSLVCTHKGCTVSWVEPAGEFRCPCHKGRFDRFGKVLAGKPKRPLEAFEVEVRGDDVWVLNQPDATA